MVSNTKQQGKEESAGTVSSFQEAKSRMDEKREARKTSRLSELSKKAADAAEIAQQSVQNTFKQYPWQAIAVCVGVGVLAGFFTFKR